MPWIFLGIVVEAILGVVYLTTRRGAVLAAMAGALLLVVAGLVTERLVITERKRVRMDLDAAVAAIQANDLPRAESYIAASSRSSAGDWKAYASQVEFEEIRIRNVEIEINHLTSPPTASCPSMGIGQVPASYGHVAVRPVMQEPSSSTWSKSRTAGKWKPFKAIRAIHCETTNKDLARNTFPISW